MKLKLIPIGWYRSIVHKREIIRNLDVVFLTEKIDNVFITLRMTK